MIQEKRPQSATVTSGTTCNPEAGCLYALITNKRSVSRRNRASWFLSQLNKSVECNELETSTTNSPIPEELHEPAEQDDNTQVDPEASELLQKELTDIKLISITSLNYPDKASKANDQFYVTPNTKVLFLSRSVATSIILDLSPSIVSVSPQNGCIFLDSLFDALKRTLQLLVKSHEIPSSLESRPPILEPKVLVSVIAYTPFVVAKSNQVMIQNRRISAANLDQVLVEIWICLSRLTQEIHELVSSTSGMDLDFGSTRAKRGVFSFAHPSTDGVIRHPGTVLEDIYEIGLFSSSLMPRLSRLSLIVITDGLFSSSNNLNVFRLKSIAISFISLGTETAYPDSCFGYAPYVDLMKFVSKSTQGVYISHQDLLRSSQVLSKSKKAPFMSNPLNKLFCWALHSEMFEESIDCKPQSTCCSRFEQASDPIEVKFHQVAKFFCVDQPIHSLLQSQTGDGDQNILEDMKNYHDWRSFRQLERSLDADFEQVLSSLLREGYLIKNIQFKHKETSRIVARLVLHWRYNLDLEQELSAPYWSKTDPYDLGDNNQLRILNQFQTPIYGDTYCEIIVHGSYSFLHNLFCDKRTKRRSEYKETAYRQFRHLMEGVIQTHERLQYLSRFYRDSSLSKVPSFLLHGNSLLYEQPHTHRLTTTVDNVTDEKKISEFQEYWQKISCLDTKSWKNLMHVHTLRLVLEHDQPKHKNIHCQNANGRYTHVQCRRSLSAISNFIKGYASFALLEDTTYIKFIYNNDDDLREIETSATKGFIVIRINKLLPTVVIHLMFTSGILDLHRAQIVYYLEQQLVNCKLRNTRTPSTGQADSILRSKTILPSSESCCVLIKSPLERMLKVYSRNFINDYLLNNIAHGLPGSCPYNLQQSVRVPINNNEPASKTARPEASKESQDENNTENSINRYNLVFSKYLYGVRVVQTITNLPHDIVSSLISNVLSKISAILVNLRIKQGFHIAFNNSGILNLVVEVAMKDQSNEGHSSNCLCQYIAFPPTVTNCSQSMHSVLNNSNTGISSKPCSLSGSLANSDNYIKNAQDSVSNSNLRGDNCEIKVIREYWIEQQYGISSANETYHPSLENMRYPEIVDHLFLSDSSIFEYLLTYDLLQLLCDKLSPYYELDLSFARSESKLSPILSPTISADSSNTIEQNSSSLSPKLPSSLIEGNTRNSAPKVPLMEKEYRFSVVKFLDHCQQANLNVLLFKDHSDFFEPDELEKEFGSFNKPPISAGQIVGTCKRKMSMDFNEHEYEHAKREHRSSYQLDGASSFTYMNPLYSPSLNHLFLETLHKRLKQLHDKELQLTDYDLKLLPAYLKKRILFGPNKHEVDIDHDEGQRIRSQEIYDDDDKSVEDEETPKVEQQATTYESINWRCFMRKGNQDNLMIVITPASLSDAADWVSFVNSSETIGDNQVHHEPICPIFVFRCSSTMVNDKVLSFLKEEPYKSASKENELESDLDLHFGQPCIYLGKLQTNNDELSVELLPNIRYGALNQASSDDKTLEVVHFRAFLRKIKNTVLKSRFSALNESYLSELFIHKDDILYYINNVDMDTQKKYHVSSQLKNLADFIKSYEDFNDSLPKVASKPCNQLLNSILLQKCGLFINQPITRFNEANPLMKHLHDRKLLYLMRCNFKIELPILEENLADSRFLKNFLKPIGLFAIAGQSQQTSSTTSSSVALHTLINEPSQSSSIITPNQNVLASSLGRSEYSRLSEMKSGSVGASSGSPGAMFSDRYRTSQAPRFSPQSSAMSSYQTLTNDSVILEAFKGFSCSIKNVKRPVEDDSDIELSLRHEAHMAEVLKLKGERKESHQYRRVLKSKSNYSQSHGAIDQALKRVDSLGRLEHFCLTPLLFSPSWRSNLAPVRDHTIEPARYHNMENYQELSTCCPTNLEANSSTTGTIKKSSDMLSGDQLQVSSQQQEADERWHQTVCNNYIKEYEQYIQTLGFNSVQIRYPSGSKSTAMMTPQASFNSSVKERQPSRKNSRVSAPSHSVSKTPGSSKHSISVAVSSSPQSSASNTYNTGYLIKFLNGGCLVFKVGFCKPYVYSILYSIEGERFNNSQARMNMTTFLDELDNIKVTMHLHSFTYDYHLRSIYSYISGRQLTFSPGYHLISFVDDFRKYYQKAPNYARNHILSGEITITNLKVNGQQLYNHIVTHNSAYNMDVLEMSSNLSHLITNLSSKFIESSDSNHSNKESSNSQDSSNHQTRSHANDYVLIELKREKVRYKDGRDFDIFDCGLLITHEVQQTSLNKNSLTLKYFLLLTNQRELYPKLVHTDESVISLGCHRPIRLGMVQHEKQKQQQLSNSLIHKQTTTIAATLSSGHSDPEDLQSSELQSSGEVSGPQSIISTANSVQSSSSGLQFGGQLIEQAIPADDLSITSSSTAPKIKLNETEESPELVRSKLSSAYANQVVAEAIVHSASSADGDSSLTGGKLSPTPPTRRRRTVSSSSNTNNNAAASNSNESATNKLNTMQDRAICDEEITYLGYFSSEEMDMLKFLQEKTANLRHHIERMVRQAEIHYRRDSLWQKLMQRPATKSDEIPLSIDELSQLLTIVEVIDLATLDPQLSLFTGLHFNWYTKLAKSFMDLKQSSTNTHRIYYVKASKILLLYIDPAYTSAFILLTMDTERSCIELNLLIKDRVECGLATDKSKSSKDLMPLSPSSIELDKYCQRLISDFINFCASFMWSTLLASA